MHAEGHRFEPDKLHQYWKIMNNKIKFVIVDDNPERNALRKALERRLEGVKLPDIDIISEEIDIEDIVGMLFSRKH